MPDFQPTQVEFGDTAGYGVFDIGHGREHITFVNFLATQGIQLPDPDLLTLIGGGPVTPAQMQTHQVIHNLLRGYTGVGGVDYTTMRLDQEADFYAFLSYHEAEHAQLRAAFGLT